MKVISVLILFVSIVSCSNKTIKQTNNSSNKVYNHQSWNDLLQKNVSENGKVNYKGFIEEREKFEGYLKYLTKNMPNENHNEATQIAYWINVYNAFTVKLIVDNYPVKSIKDIKSGIPFINDVWAIEFIEFSKEKLSLNNVEHGILRKDFKEPRIHFAVNCASYSCPKLYNRAFTSEKLETQLTFLAKDFLSDMRKNDITNPKNIKISKLFSWYRFDFKQDGKSIIDFINQYSDVEINGNATVNYLDYNWSLNE